MSERVVLGVDPGSRVMGFGALRLETFGKIELISCGVIRPPLKFDLNRRLGILSEEFELLLEKIRPDVVAIERVFLGKNADSAFKLGHARGLAVAASVRAGCEIAEYAPRAVKKGITGNGSAMKEQVQIVLLSALSLNGKTQADAGDALALAYHHARRLEVLGKLGRQTARGIHP